MDYQRIMESKNWLKNEKAKIWYWNDQIIHNQTKTWRAVPEQRQGGDEKFEEAKRKWTDDLATQTELEKAADNGRMKEVYDITKNLSSDKAKTCNTVKKHEWKPNWRLTDEAEVEGTFRGNSQQTNSRQPCDKCRCDCYWWNETAIENISSEHISKSKIWD